MVAFVQVSLLPVVRSCSSGSSCAFKSLDEKILRSIVAKQPGVTALQVKKGVNALLFGKNY